MAGRGPAWRACSPRPAWLWEGRALGDLFLLSGLWTPQPARRGVRSRPALGTVCTRWTVVTGGLAGAGPSRRAAGGEARLGAWLGREAQAEASPFPRAPKGTASCLSALGPGQSPGPGRAVPTLPAAPSPGGAGGADDSAMAAISVPWFPDAPSWPPESEQEQAWTSTAGGPWRSVRLSLGC